MPAPSTPGLPDLSTVEVQALLLIGERIAQDYPLRRGPELADRLGLDEPAARRVLARLEALRLLHEVDEPRPRRVLPDGDLPDLLADPARPSAELQRRDLEIAVYRELVARWSRDYPVRDGYLPGPTGRPLLPDTRRRVLARLRDPERQGGALLWPYGALVLTREGEAARGALLSAGVGGGGVGSLCAS